MPIVIPLSLYVCPICGAKVSAKKLTKIWCQCLPSTPTVMNDAAQMRDIARAIGRTPLPR